MGLERMLKSAMTNKYVLYVVLFIAITNVVGYLASQDYDSLVFFVITGFLTSYFSDNMTVILLAALVVSNVFLASRKARTIREGMSDGKKKGKKEGDDESEDDEDNEDDEEGKKKEKKHEGKDHKDKEKKEEMSGVMANNKDKGEKKKEKYSGMQKLSPAAIGEDIDVKATNHANFGEVEAQLSASDMNELNGETNNLRSAQADLQKQIQAMGPLMDSANSMMQNLGGMEGLSGMLNQANSMMSSMAPMLDKLNMTGGKNSDVLNDAAPLKTGKEGAATVEVSTGGN